MHQNLRSMLLLAAAVAAGALPAAAQQTASANSATSAGSVTADLNLDMGQVEKKFMDLARAIPADKYSWRPGEGVRSVGEVLLHVAADNYLLASALGFPADASTGIKGSDYNTAVAFEKRTMNRDAILSELQKSFTHVRSGLTGTTPNKLTDKVNLFGQSFSVQQAWILTVTHAHEHLGQLIAYARSNGVAPPWN